MAHETNGLQKKGIFTHLSKVKIKREFKLNSSKKITNMFYIKNMLYNENDVKLGVISFPSKYFEENREVKGL